MTARAALALALLLGYFVLAAAVVAGLVWLTVTAVRAGAGGFVGGKLAIFTGLVAVAVVRAVLAVERRGGDAEDGLPVSRAEQPQLWALVDDVARELRVPPPDDLRLVDDVNAFVHQDTRLLGLLGGRRHMGLGVGLLQVLTVDQLRAVVAHELGHYAGGDTRLSALVYRASTTVGRTVRNLGPTSVLGQLFGLYARLYDRVSLAVRRRQELRADEGSVTVVGRSTHEAALREARAAGLAWDFFLDRYVAPLWEAGAAPADAYAGFRALLADPVRREQVDAVRCEDDDGADPYDSHPSLAARVAHVRALADRPAPGDARPARALLAAPERVEAAVTALVNGQVLRRVPETLYAFPVEPGERLDPGPYAAGLAAPVADLSRATAAVDGGPVPAGVGRTLALLEAGRDGDLVTELTGDRRHLDEESRRADLRELVGGPLALSASTALIAAGRAQWCASWSAPLRLVDPAGADLDVDEALVEALDAGGPQALRSALEGLGVPLADAALPVAVDAAWAPEEAVLAVWPELARGRRRFDGIVTRDDLVLVPQPRSARGNLRRNVAANYGIGREGVRRTATERVHALLDQPLASLRARPEVTVLRWDDLPAVGFKAGLATAWVLRLPGQPKPFDRLKAEDDGLVPPPPETAALLRQLVGDRLDSEVD